MQNLYDWAPAIGLCLWFHEISEYERSSLCYWVHLAWNKVRTGFDVLLKRRREDKGE